MERGFRSKQLAMDLELFNLSANELPVAHWSLGKRLRWKLVGIPESLAQRLRERLFRNESNFAIVSTKKESDDCMVQSSQNQARRSAA